MNCCKENAEWHWEKEMKKETIVWADRSSEYRGKKDRIFHCWIYFLKKISFRSTWGKNGIYRKKLKRQQGIIVMEKTISKSNKGYYLSFTTFQIIGATWHFFFVAWSNFFVIIPNTYQKLFLLQSLNLHFLQCFTTIIQYQDILNYLHILWGSSVLAFHWWAFQLKGHKHREQM